MNIFSWIINAILIENVILSRFLGTCPFLGVSKDKKSAMGMGLAVVIVMTLSSVLSWIIYKFLLLKYNLVYMRTIIFILVIASFVQMLEMIMKKITPALYKGLGIYLPLITTNCAVLGIATIVSNYTFIKSLIVYKIFTASAQPYSLSPILRVFSGFCHRNLAYSPSFSSL